MQIRFNCPTDRCVAIIEYEPLEACAGSIRCPRCGVEHTITVTESMILDETVDRCAVCGSKELFTRKDFPQRIGLAVVLVFGLLAIYLFTVNLFYAFGVLTLAVLIDLVIYLSIGKCTTCYACRAEYRKCKLNPAHEDFELSTSEKY